MKKIYDGLLFDMDGVLVNVTNSYRKAIQKTTTFFLKRTIYMNEVDGIKKKVGMNNDWDATYALINNKQISYEAVKKVFQSIYWGEGCVRGLINDESLFVSKSELVQLKSIYGKLGIATGRPRKEAEYTLSRFGIGGFFDVVICKEDTKKEKPSPDPLVYAMKKMGTSNVIYIGDSVSDVIAAKAASIPCIYVGGQDKGTIRFRSMSQVIDYLL